MQKFPPNLLWKVIVFEHKYLIIFLCGLKEHPGSQVQYVVFMGRLVGQSRAGGRADVWNSGDLESRWGMH